MGSLYPGYPGFFNSREVRSFTYMKVIVGLGNPGPRYRDTRHNVGFQTLEELASRHQIQREESRFDAIIAHLQVNHEKVFLLKPLTYMNLSGKAVRALVAYYKLDLQDIIVVYDDMDLPVGSVRLRPAGGTGGHRGMTSLVESLGSRDFARIRIELAGLTTGGRLGFGAVSPGKASYQRQLSGLHAAECWLAHGIDKAMNEYNE